RKLPALPIAGIESQWLEKLASELKSETDRALLCRRTLCEIAYPQFAANWETAVGDPKLPVPTRLALSSLDPRNVTLEPEYYAECDDARFQKVKPLLWLWYSFDRTVAGGQNVELGVQFRRLLAPYIFKRCGENFKAFQHVEFSFGYNIEAGDNVVVHRHVLLDDRGGISLGNNVSISDYANVYSHTHSIDDQRDVPEALTRLDAGGPYTRPPAAGRDQQEAGSFQLTLKAGSKKPSSCQLPARLSLPTVVRRFAGRPRPARHPRSSTGAARHAARAPPAAR